VISSIHTRPISHLGPPTAPRSNHEKTRAWLLAMLKQGKRRGWSPFDTAAPSSSCTCRFTALGLVAVGALGWTCYNKVTAWRCPDLKLSDDCQELSPVVDLIAG
jgi:hypothetical protein